MLLQAPVGRECDCERVDVMRPQVCGHAGTAGAARFTANR